MSSNFNKCLGKTIKNIENLQVGKKNLSFKKVQNPIDVPVSLYNTEETEPKRPILQIVFQEQSY